MSTQRATGPVTRILVRHGFAWMGWFWPIVAVVFLVIGFFTQRAGDLDHSVWAFAGSAPKWALFALGIVFATMYLPFLVAHGITRRTVAAAAAAGGAVLALVAAGVMQLGYLVERAVFAALDRTHAIETPHLFRTPTQVHLVLAEYTLVFAAFLLSGWLVGIGYYRFGGIRGTLFLPPALIPIGVVEGAVLASDWPEGILDALNVVPGNVPVAVGASLAVLAAGFVAARALTGGVAIKPRTT